MWNNAPPSTIIPYSKRRSPRSTLLPANCVITRNYPLNAKGKKEMLLTLRNTASSQFVIRCTLVRKKKKSTRKERWARVYPLMVQIQIKLLLLLLLCGSVACVGFTGTHASYNTMLLSPIPPSHFRSRLIAAPPRSPWRCAAAAAAAVTARPAHTVHTLTGNTGWGGAFKIRRTEVDFSLFLHGNSWNQQISLKVSNSI